MNKENIYFTKASLSLHVSDVVIDRLSDDTYKIVYIDYIYNLVILLNTENSTTDGVSFDDITYNFQKVGE